MDKPTQPISPDTTDTISRFYGSVSRDKLNQLTDVEFTVWVANNKAEIEHLLMFIQRETARAAATAEADVNLNSHMLAQAQILNRTYELAEEGQKNKEVK